MGELFVSPRYAVVDLASRIEQTPHALNVQELGDLLELGKTTMDLLEPGKTTMYDMVTADDIPYYRIRGSIRFDSALTANWLRARLIEARKERKKAA